MSLFVWDAEPSKVYVGGGEVSSVWVGDTKVWPANTFEYVLLSEWWDVNRFSELTLTWLSCINNVIDYRQWYVNQTDTYWMYRKMFTEEIVWFEFVCENENINYDSVIMELSKTNKFRIDGSWSKLRYFFYDSLWVISSSAWYSSSSSTWYVEVSETINWVGNAWYLANYTKNSSTTRVKFKGILNNWVWTITTTTATWQAWTDTFTPDSNNTDLHCVWFRASRWFTGNSWRIISAKVTLQSTQNSEEPEPEEAL